MTRLTTSATTWLTALGLACILGLISPTAGQTQDIEADGELELTSAEPGHVAGQYAREGIVVRFDSVVNGGGMKLQLRTADGAPLLMSNAENGTYDVQVLGDRLRLTGSFEVGEAPEDEPKVQGDLEATEAIVETPEYKALPYLSRALGARGLGGQSHPASMPLHQLAMASARHNKVSFGAPKAEPSETAAGAPEDSSYQCLDQRGDPCQDDCFGMCGPGCTCWTWVCGTCCIWKSCYTHDKACEEWDCFGSAKGWLGCFGAAPWAALAPCHLKEEQCTDRRKCNIPDPTCENGVAADNVCCAESCGTCGGTGCGSRPGGANSCCMGNILEANRSCGLNEAPCVIPDPQCERGLAADGICCDKECGSCTGTGCSSRPGGASNCCRSSIEAAGLSCADDEAPCIIPDPKCENGIIGSGNICCPASCGSCTGTGCGSRPGGAWNCCAGNIRESGVSCAEGQAPCVMPVVDTSETKARTRESETSGFLAPGLELAPSCSGRR
jgi:hypothetical protein